MFERPRPRSHGLPFRVGTTSYIYREDILPNVRQLAPWVDDVEIVIYEFGERSPLPDENLLSTLREIGDQHGLSYTVHLPLDLALASPDAVQREMSVSRAAYMIEATMPLRPWAWIVHAEGGGAPSASTAQWEQATKESFRDLVKTTGEVERICLENVESMPPEPVLALTNELEIGFCLDLGHVFKMGLDPLPYLGEPLPRARVVHLHGWNGQWDHVSLATLPAERLGSIWARLWEVQYAGVITLEVFNEEDLLTSLDCLAHHYLLGNHSSL